MQLFISKYLSIDANRIAVDGKVLLEHNDGGLVAEDAYRALAISYPKFFKMDLLCKWATLSAECLLKNDSNKEQSQRYVYEGLDKNAIAVVLMTASGCLDVDKKYLHSMETVASPALFVYTLPNIMLGEICIRHGFKGDQLSMVSEAPDVEELHFWVSDLLQNRGMDACLCGWVEAVEGKQEIRLIWVDKKSGVSFSRDNLTKYLKPL